MDATIKIMILLFLTIFVGISIGEKDQPQYTPVEKACEKCSCHTTDDEVKSKHFILNCSVKNMKHVFAEWPAEFGENHTGSEIIALFSGNPIQELHQLPETQATVSFSCRHCNLTEIGAAIFMDVVNIKRIDLSWNKITGDQLRADIFRGRYSNREYDPIPLEDLDLSHNDIHTLEKRVFEHTPHLNKLNLAYNQFDLIDLNTNAALNSVPELTHLDLSYNLLEVLPDTLFNPLTQLHDLRLEGNKFKTIPFSFNQLSGSLRTLFMGANLIDRITVDSFIDFTKLKYLNMSNMSELTAVESGSFAHLTALEVVIFKDNPKMEVFDIESLKEAKNLRQLDISNCNLKKLNADYEFEMPLENRTKYWENLHQVRLFGNPWNCDCFMAHTLQEIVLYNNASKYSNFKARCASPYEATGKLLDEVTVSKACPLASMGLQVLPSLSLDGHPMLQENAIILIVVSATLIVGLAFVVGFGIVMIRRKLHQSTSIFTTPIRYTTVRNSTMSTMSSVAPQ